MICKNICLYGDSIAMGIGVPEQRFSWASILEQKYKNINFHNHGVGGETSSIALKRIDDVLKDSPQITTIQFGMNDHCIDENGLYAVSPSIFKKNIITMIKSLTEIDSKVLLITNHRVIEGNDKQYYFNRHPHNSYTKFGGANLIINKYNEIIREIAIKRNIRCIDMYSISSNFDKYQFLRSLKNSDKDDGVHPHILGSKIYANEISNAINQLMENL